MQKIIVMLVFALLTLTSHVYACDQDHFYATSESNVTALTIPDVWPGDVYQCVATVQLTSHKMPRWLFGGFGSDGTSTMSATINGEPGDPGTVGKMYPCAPIPDTSRAANICQGVFFIDVGDFTTYERPGHLDLWSSLNIRGGGKIEQISDSIYCRKIKGKGERP